MWERQGRRRARAAVLLGLAGLLVTVPATTDGLRSGSGSLLASPDARHAATAVEQARVRPGAGPVARPWEVAAPAAAQPAPIAAAAAATERVIAPPPTTFDAPPPAPAAPPAVLQASAAPRAAGGVWAVVIGIDDYPGSRSDLRESVHDANTVDAALAGYGIPGDHRLVLRNTQATAAVIRDAARWLVARAGHDATAVFFYAGHVRKLGRGSEAIVAADGQLVTDRALGDLLRPLAARQTWIVLASCYAGGFSEVLGPNRILTAAAGPNSLAYENTTYANSYLVEYMIERAMLQGRASGSVEQAFAWAQRSLQSDHPNRVPVQYDQLDGELRLGTPSSSQPQQPPPRQAPPPAGGSPPTTAPPEDEDQGCLLTLGSIANCDAD